MFHSLVLRMIDVNKFNAFSKNNIDSAIPCMRTYSKGLEQNVLLDIKSREHGSEYYCISEGEPQDKKKTMNNGQRNNKKEVCKHCRLKTASKNKNRY